MIHSERDAELAALSLHESQIDAWICALADEVQREVDTLIRDRRLEGGAVELLLFDGDRVLQGALVGGRVTDGQLGAVSR